MRFTDKRSPEFVAAVRALHALLETESLDSVSRAYAEVASGASESIFAKGKKKRASNHVCLHRLKGRRNCPDGPKHPCDSPNFPGQDHLTEWVESGRTTVIVSQPYGMSFETLCETVAFCERNGLRADISASRSFYFPGQTLAVEYKPIKKLEGV